MFLPRWERVGHELLGMRLVCVAARSKHRRYGNRLVPYPIYCRSGVERGECGVLCRVSTPDSTVLPGCHCELSLSRGLLTNSQTLSPRSLPSGYYLLFYPGHKKGVYNHKFSYLLNSTPFACDIRTQHDSCLVYISNASVI